MLFYSLAMVGVAAAVAFVMLRPGMLASRAWRATVTPLASIIGSGFLVVGPILAHAAGNFAWVAMVALCAVAYLFGYAIRRNILHVEPELQQEPPIAIVALEQLSYLVLAFCYFISVAYYLNLFASFSLRGVGVIDQNATRMLSSLAIVLIGGFGAYHRLRGLETIEELAVGIKLSLIGGLLAAMGVAIAFKVLAGNWALARLDHEVGTHELRILMGLVILVQGFETSRYLGHTYDREMRVRTMRNAQLLATGIYVSFILLLTPFFSGPLPAEGGETTIIDMLAPLGVLVAPLVIVAAVASQLSAAVADMNGASGMLSAATSRRVSTAVGYVMTAAVALLVTWSANIFEIIAYATKAFVAYYALQCALAALMALRNGPQRSLGLAALFGAATLLALVITVFGVPAGA
jgi:hypothetical protein